MRPSRGEPYEEGVGPSTFATASLTGCLSCIVATIRTCCCLPSRSGYAPSATSEQSLLGTRQAQQHQQPVEAELESSPLVPPPILTARADRPLLPKGQSRSDDRALQLLREGSSASGLGGAPDSKKDLKGTSKSASMLSLGLDDEEFCPTCLEPYSTDNPMVTAKCGHHYHLPCIYEWLERSPTCPMCGRKMECEELQ